MAPPALQLKRKGFELAGVLNPGAGVIHLSDIRGPFVRDPFSPVIHASGPVTARDLARSRRDFLRAATGASLLANPLLGYGQSRTPGVPKSPKVVVVTFGGGARDEETFMPDGQENIPHLMKELIPQSTFYTQVVNKGILGHYVATASLATGVYETFNNFAAVPPTNPTVFEYFRKDLNRPSHEAWVVAPSNGFNRIGESGNRDYGKGLGANVILPKRLLATALSPAGSGLYEHLLRDNYETPLYAPELNGEGLSLHEMAELLQLSVSDFSSHARNLASPDELSVYIAKQLMTKLAPSLLWVTLHDIDVAHSGSYSLYLEAIQRCDRLCAELWAAIQTNPEYSGRTSMFIMPDFGRDSDESPGGNGFQHHRTGDALSRTTWMMALGGGIRQNIVIDRPVQTIDLVPTLGARLGFAARRSEGHVLTEVA